MIGRSVHTSLPLSWSRALLEAPALCLMLAYFPRLPVRAMPCSVTGREIPGETRPAPAKDRRSVTEVGSRDLSSIPPASPRALARYFGDHGRFAPAYLQWA